MVEGEHAHAVARCRSRHLVTYNVLLGALHREELVGRVLQRLAPDVVALQEVTALPLVRRLAKDLGMELLVGKPSDPSSTLHNVILSRFPVVRWSNHRHPGRMLRSHLEAEINVGGALGTCRVHCLHLAARFGERANGEERRMGELDAVFADIAALPKAAHVLCGDFNAIAPDDVVAASKFFDHLAALTRAGLLEKRAGGLLAPRTRRAAVDPAIDDLWRSVGVPPHLDVGVPTLPRFVPAVTRRLPRGVMADRFFNRVIERWSVRRLSQSGYTDCFRAAHPRASGFTCASWLPVSRIDYVFADELVADRLARCDVARGRGLADASVFEASDHLPLVADFRR